MIIYAKNYFQNTKNSVKYMYGTYNKTFKFWLYKKTAKRG